MVLNTKEKKFVWRQIHLLAKFGLTPQNYNSVWNENREMNYPHYLPQFIDKLKGVFVGCDIIIDLLKTYLIIDWS